MTGALVTVVFGDTGTAYVEPACTACVADLTRTQPNAYGDTVAFAPLTAADVACDWCGAAVTS